MSWRQLKLTDKRGTYGTVHQDTAWAIINMIYAKVREKRDATDLEEPFVATASLDGSLNIYVYDTFHACIMQTSSSQPKMRQA